MQFTQMITPTYTHISNMLPSCCPISGEHMNHFQLIQYLVGCLARKFFYLHKAGHMAGVGSALIPQFQPA